MVLLARMALMAFSFQVSPTFACPLKARDGNQMRRSQTLVVRCADTQKESGIRRGGGITQPRPISPAMQKFLGVSEIPRTKAIKKIWEYIKEKDLQDPANRREIVCDENLKSIFGGRERVGFLEISGLMKPHFIKE